MNVFGVRERVVGQYRDYMQSFVHISTPRIADFVQRDLAQGRLWPDPLVQLNPSFRAGGGIDELVADGVLDPRCADIFRVGKAETFGGSPMRLHAHQREALEAAQAGASYVLTTGTGSGKSLAYFVPIIDRILRDGPGRGIRAIVVYPMNALANSQMVELGKFLGEDPARRPVSFASYTGQTNEEEREAILDHPPDILITNYVMLELILTRSQDIRIIDQHARQLQFLVLDELHTYRGRQGADVAMLVRRVRERIANPTVQCVGTSATMSSRPSLPERQAEIASVASLLFGVEVEPRHVIGETLDWTTVGTMPTVEDLTLAVIDIHEGNTPIAREAFRRHPLACWVERYFGLREEADILVRQTPRTIAEGGRELAEKTGLAYRLCAGAIQQILLTGYELTDPATERSLFAFRLHQFISGGDAVYSTLDPAVADRHLTTAGQLFIEDDEHGLRMLYPLAFCRECGGELYPVDWIAADEASGSLRPRPIRDRARKDETTRKSGYLWFDPDGRFSLSDGKLDEHLPEDWLEEHHGTLRVKSSNRMKLPIPVDVSLDGAIQLRSDDAACKGSAWFLPAPLPFCPYCRHAWAGRRGDFAKVAALAVEGRATPTTIISLATVAALHEADGLGTRAKKLLSFTDNRQDASLQAGHFNDFIRTGLLRGAILAAVQRSIDGLGSVEIAQAVFSALDLPFEDYALRSDISERRRDRPRDVMRRIVGYHVFRDLRRGWRVNAPNLEQVGLLSVVYEGLHELCADDSAWRDTDPRLRAASPTTRHELCRVVLDHFRRELAIHTEYLDGRDLERLKSEADAHLDSESAWNLNTGPEPEPSVRIAVRASGSGLFGTDRAITPRSRIGQYLGRAKTWGDAWMGPLDSGTRLAILRDLCAVLAHDALLVSEPGPTPDEPFYRLQSDYMRWQRGDGRPRRDPTELIKESDTDKHANTFFRTFYEEVAESLVDPENPLALSRYVAKEHTAQVPALLRQEREDDFREARIAVLYCSPTMELGVDISDLNAVNMRNVPPTPANYAQRSGRAGRSGQPALVVTFCTAGSPHDQYYFQNRREMVAGVVAPPRIDLANEDLVASHLHAVWLAETGQNLGRTLDAVLDLTQEDLPLRRAVQVSFANSGARERALGRARRIMTMIAPHIGQPTWLVDGWVETLLLQAPVAFEQACQRWRTLYRAAVRQLNENNERRQNPVYAHGQQREAERLWKEAARQLDLLKDEGKVNADFYSYRYIASEGFLPGYNFPRLPLTAYLPTGRSPRNRFETGDDFVSRGRFVAISEFGPGNFIYYEGNRYIIDRVILPPRGEDGAFVSEGRFCPACGYGAIRSHATTELCDHCGAPLAVGGEGLSLDNLFRMENVTTRLADRITSDEEERQRMGYELLASYRFREGVRGPDFQRAELQGDEVLAELTYAPAATIWRLNLGWRRRRQRNQYGFLMDSERGKWSRSEISEQASDEVPETLVEQMGASDREANLRVVPYVEDTRNLLVVRGLALGSSSQVVTLGAALKRGIEAVYQLEDNELSLEILQQGSHPATLLFYEAAEGGAGVLARLVREPDALAAVARKALAIAHFIVEGSQIYHDPDAPCVAACYHCLLNYRNQRYHRDLDRRLLPDILQPWLIAKAVVGSGDLDRAALRERLIDRSESELERDFIRYLDARGAILPDRAQHLIEAAGTRPDFFYDRQMVAVFVDGYHHHIDPRRREEDAAIDRKLLREGYRSMRVTFPDRWDAELVNWADVLGPGRER